MMSAFKVGEDGNGNLGWWETHENLDAFYFAVRYATEEELELMEQVTRKSATPDERERLKKLMGR